MLCIDLHKQQRSKAWRADHETHQNHWRKTHGQVCSLPLGLKGVVVGEGDTYEEATADVKSALPFHLETFGPDIFDTDAPGLEACIAAAGVARS